MLKKILGLSSCEPPDFGSRIVGYKPSTVILYNAKREMILNEPSLVAADDTHNAIIAAGSEALAHRGRGDKIIVGSPLKHGVVAQFDLARCMFKYFFKQKKLISFLKPRVALFVPVELTQVDYKIYIELFLSSSVYDVQIIEDTYHNAVGTLSAKFRFFVEIIPNNKI